MAKSSKSTADAVFSGIVRQWLQQSFSGLTRVQQMGWPVVAGGHHVLLSAPTGSGKTLAAFLWGIDTLLRLQPRAEPGVRVLYVSPLKALVYDVERNLRAPLAGIGALAAESGQDVRDVRVDVRTGDSSQAERRLQAREPADILVTTPESLYLLLGSKARQTLSSVHTVIVDEVHALAPFKRGAHLALSLERLEELAQRPPQRIGLSATVRPLEAAARFLAGDRPVEIVDAGQAPNLDLQVVVPVSDMERPVVPDARPPSQVPFPAMDPAKGAMAVQRGIWPSIHERLLEEIETSRSAILFVNSRGLCERLVQRLNELAGQPLVLAHHGSLSHARRAEIEDGLKSGRVRAIVATSSLELGVDMGAVDRVLLVESPGSVARGLQRVGRAGHQVGALSIGRIYPKFRADLLECAVVAQRMLTGEIESMRVPANPLDVLAQQLVALCCDHPRSPAQILALVRRAWPYRGLGEEVLARVLDMLTGRYPSTGMADLRPLLNWDRAADRLSPRRAAPMVSRLNGGTIPDRGSYAVHIAPDGPRIGELDEEMVYETRNGDVVTLGASSWRVEEITRDRVLVSPAPGEPGRLPFWHGDATGRPLELGRALGVMLRRLKRMSVSAARDWLLHNTPLDERAAANLADYLAEQKQLTGTLPDDRSVLVERFRDELGDWRLCILTPFGARIHAPWAMAIQRQLERSAGFEVQLLYSDDGIALRLADSEELPDVGLLLPDPAEVRDLVTEQLADSALFAALFRENAARSLLMPRRTVKGRRPLWAQRLKSQQILAAVRGFPDFPVLMETYRQCLADHFDMDGLEGILRDLHNGAIRLAEVQTPRPSPFARSLVFAYVANYIYEQDAPPAERKAQALTLDRRLLAELLGQDELRNLIDPQVLEDLELELQCLTEDRQVRDADGLHDLLRRLGDLSEQEIQDRSQSGTAPWLAQLSRQQRVVELRVAGEQRWIAAEDVALYRDALGLSPPPGLPDTLLEPVPDALSLLLNRHARCRGPYLTGQASNRLGLLSSQVEPALRLLEGQGRLVRGDIRPGGSAPEWCDAEVLRILKRRTLAVLRRQSEPVDGAGFGRFLPAWHGLRGGQDAAVPSLLEVVERLAGLPLSWSDLLERILLGRLPGFRPEDLDLLCAAGEVVWVGRGALGTRDGRVALYPRLKAPLLLDPPDTQVPEDPLQQTVLEHLERRGACFLLELEQAVRRVRPDAAKTEFEAAVWDLVWSGRITNDTFGPLRGRLQGGGRRYNPLAGGRWSLVRDLLVSEAPATERILARIWSLLDRYGVLSRAVVAVEELSGGFGPYYQVLKELETAGRVRRGWFVEGLSGAQFAHPAAVERLRAVRGGLDEDEALSADPLWLSAADPANPFGSLLPWPASRAADVQPKRLAGALVLLSSGRPTLYLSANGQRLLSFEGTDSAALDAGLRQLARMRRRRSLRILTVDGEAAAQSWLLPRLQAVGFVSDYRGLVLERSFA